MTFTIKVKNLDIGCKARRLRIIPALTLGVLFRVLTFIEQFKGGIY